MRPTARSAAAPSRTASSSSSHNQWTGLSDVRADDDAAEVRWVPIAEFLVMQDRIYEDHFFIANHFLGGLGKN